jgi:hypothetical protein
VKLGASEDGSGLRLANHLTEPGIHILATLNDTSLKLIEQGTAKRMIEP